MIRVQSLIFPKCPYCGTQLNNLALFRLSTLWYGQLDILRCPGPFGGPVCGKRFAVVSNVTVEFRALKIPGDT